MLANFRVVTRYVGSGVRWVESGIRSPGSGIKAMGLGIRAQFSANPGLNFNPGLFFFSSKAFSRTIFVILFRVANHQIVHKKN